MTEASGPEFEIEKLRREHDLSRFDCRNATLNAWLQKYAWTNQQADSAKTYVGLASNLVVGYYVLTAGSVHKDESPERIAKGLANHPIGVVLLARLAVDNRHQGKGLGKALLFDALSRIEEPLMKRLAASTNTSNSSRLQLTLFSCCCRSRIYARPANEPRSNASHVANQLATRPGTSI